MLDWIFEAIIEWVSSVVTQLMDAVSGLFLNALGTDMLAMEEYFPFISKAFTVVQYTAWSLLFLITVWQLFRAFAGPIAEAENPWTLLLRSALFAVLIGFAKPIFMYVLDIARAPYTAFMDIPLRGEDFTFAGVENVLKNGLESFILASSVVGTLLIIILMVALGWNYFKLLLEVVERYVVVGVICYTSPLAYSAGASKSTVQIFKSWCRMVGSQLLLLVMNVWFLRGFNSSIGYYIGSGGALSNGQGSIFLWLFCALAFLKTAQRFDSYLASIGMNVAQTGLGLGMDIIMAARAVSDMGGGFRSGGSIFRNPGSPPASGIGSTIGSGMADKFKGNSYVRDSVVEGGVRMDAGGSFGFVGRMFGSIAAKNGVALTGESISSVAARTPNVSGSIAGDIADRSLQNYIPNMQGQTLSGTQITGGHISTNIVGSDGKQTAVEMFSASQYNAPESPYAAVTASDGSEWYQIADGPDAGAIYDIPVFSGDASEADKIAASFPDISDGTVLRTIDNGEIEAVNRDGNAIWYSSAYFEEPHAPHSIIQSSNGVNWYAMSPYSNPPIFEAGEEAYEYNQRQFYEFMPGYEHGIITADSSGSPDGYFEVRHEDGSGARFYDTARYAVPHGAYQVYEDSSGGRWYAVQGEAAVSHIPVYEDGKPVYNGDNVVSISVDTVRYRSEPSRFKAPERRNRISMKQPNRKR